MGLIVGLNGDPLADIKSPGERDLTLGQITRMGAALLGRRYSIYRRDSGRCVVAVFTDDDWHLRPIERAMRGGEKVLGDGVSFAEAFHRAKIAVEFGACKGLDLRIPIPPTHDAPDDGKGACGYGCHR